MPSDRGMDREDVYIYMKHTHNRVSLTHTVSHTHTMEYHLALKQNEIMPLATTWMDLEITIPSEVRQ